jgi:hypothetical protein
VLTLHPLTLLSFFVGILLAASCGQKASDVPISVPNEGITTFIYTATPIAGGEPSIAKWNQKLGPDGNPIGQPDTSEAVLTLKANTIYKGAITIYDSTQTPVADATKEIQNLGQFHHFFFQPIPSNQALIIPNTANTSAAPLQLFITETDHDSSANQYPIGLETLLTTLGPSQGKLRVVLRHQPNGKDGTYAPGSSDIDIWLRITIQP